MYLQKWNQQLIILFIHADFSPWLISLVVGVINFISNTDYSGTFRQALVELLISNHIVSLTPSLSISYRVKCLLNVKGDCLAYYLKMNVIYNVGNGEREEAEILLFLLALIHYHFQFTYCLCKGRIAGVAVLISQLHLLRWVLSSKCAQTGLSSGHSPCVWEISYTAFYKRQQTRFPSRGAEVAVDYSSGRRSCGTCSMGELALCWSQCGTILWKHSLVPAFLLGIDHKVRWRTLYLFRLAVPRNIFSKNDRPPGRELHCSGIVKQL